jgi:hypothetical protein
MAKAINYAKANEETNRDRENRLLHLNRVRSLPIRTSDNSSLRARVYKCCPLCPFFC